MKPSQRSASLFIIIMLMAFTLVTPFSAWAYNQYSQNGDNTYCASCHGDFRSNSYTSPVDGQSWGNIHNIHRFDMLGGDCEACHISSGRFPVLLDESAGGDGLAAIGCIGCHGRDEDNVAGNPSSPFGRGAGLRQHHFRAGTTICLDCHDDSDPTNYTPVGETVLPPYYANPGNNHSAMPTTACNDDGSENFAGATIGLDNDGDLLYDTDDTNCNLSAVPGQVAAGAILNQNHPNPFNPTTRISFSLDTGGQVDLRIYDTRGQLVRTLRSEVMGAGSHHVAWNGTDQSGHPMSSGVYFLTLRTQSGTLLQKMMLMK